MPKDGNKMNDLKTVPVNDTKPVAAAAAKPQVEVTAETDVPVNGAFRRVAAGTVFENPDAGLLAYARKNKNQCRVFTPAAKK